MASPGWTVSVRALKSDVMTVHPKKAAKRKPLGKNAAREKTVKSLPKNAKVLIREKLVERSEDSKRPKVSGIYHFVEWHPYKPSKHHIKDGMTLGFLLKEAEFPAPQGNTFYVVLTDGNHYAIALDHIMRGNVPDIAALVAMVAVTAAKHVIIYSSKESLRDCEPKPFEIKLINVCNDALKILGCKVQDLCYFLPGRNQPYSYRVIGHMPDEIFNNL